eukprot:7724526-Pyramimonas_sp.AAC.1
MHRRCTADASAVRRDPPTPFVLLGAHPGGLCARERGPGQDGRPRANPGLRSGTSLHRRIAQE